jgi:hypothetical protein
MVCRECRSIGIDDSFVVERPVEHPVGRTAIVRVVWNVCLTPATCKTFEIVSNERTAD